MPVILPSLLLVAHAVSTIDLLIPLSKHPVLFLFLNFSFLLSLCLDESISHLHLYDDIASRNGCEGVFFLKPSPSAVPQDNLMLARILITFSL